MGAKPLELQQTATVGARWKVDNNKSYKKSLKAGNVIKVHYNQLIANVQAVEALQLPRLTDEMFVGTPDAYFAQFIDLLKKMHKVVSFKQLELPRLRLTDPGIKATRVCKLIEVASSLQFKLVGSPMNGGQMQFIQSVITGLTVKDTVLQCIGFLDYNLTLMVLTQFKDSLETNVSGLVFEQLG